MAENRLNPKVIMPLLETLVGESVRPWSDQSQITTKTNTGKQVAHPSSG
jgi:hypothetical protein